MSDLSMITGIVIFIIAVGPTLIGGIFLMIASLRSDTVQLMERTDRLESELRAAKFELERVKGR